MRPLPPWRRDYLKGVLTILAATVFWSLSGLFVRLVPAADPWQINGYRALSMTAAIVAFLLVVYGRQTWQRFAALDRGAVAATAGFYALGTTLYIVALSRTPVANVACLTATSPIFAALLARLLLGERPGTAAWIACGLAFLGIGVIFGSELAAGDLLGNAVAVVVAFCFAGQTVVLRKYRNIDVLPAMCVGGLVVFAILPLLRGGFDIDPRDLPVILAMGVVQMAIPVILFVRGARHVPAVQMTLIGLLDVLFNPLFAWIGVGEVPAAAMFAGGGVIVAAVLLMVLGGRRSPGVVPSVAGES
jgi:drug/metabolite transporter (DMT)-like permease